MHAYALLGLVAAVVVGVWWVGTGENPLDKVGDLVSELTSSEEERISKLEPATQAQARALVAKLEDQYGIRTHVGQTLRTPAQEKAVVDAGKSAVKTHSWHELGRALDLYPLDPDTGRPDYDAKNLDAYRTMHLVAAEMGFRGIAFNEDGTKRLITNAAGKKIWDGGHLEWRSPYSSIAEAVRKEGEAFGIG